MQGIYLVLLHGRWEAVLQRRRDIERRHKRLALLLRCWLPIQCCCIRCRGLLLAWLLLLIRVADLPEAGRGCGDAAIIMRDGSATCIGVVVIGQLDPQGAGHEGVQVIET